MKTYDWIVNESKLPWLKLNISFPYEEMYREAVSLKEYFVAHRDKDGDAASGGYSHKGWRSLCIHGIDHEKTNHFVQYGYNSHEETLIDGPISAINVQLRLIFLKTTFLLKNTIELDTCS